MAAVFDHVNIVQIDEQHHDNYYEDSFHVELEVILLQ
jgi:hypothetical protein